MSDDRSPLGWSDIIEESAKNRQEADTKNDNEENFSEYVAYAKYGQIVKRLPRDLLEGWLANVEKSNGSWLALGCWELERDGKAILARLHPSRELDKRDDNWRHPYYVFWPYIP